MTIKKGDGLATVVDNCSLHRLNSEKLDNVYLPASIGMEFLTGSLNGQATSKVWGNVVKTFNDISEASSIVNNENYKQIRNIVTVAYEVAADREPDDKKKWDKIIGLKRDDFVDSVSGILYDLLYKEVFINKEFYSKGKESVKLTCANTLSDKELKQKIIEALKPLNELEIDEGETVFDSLGIIFQEEKDQQDILTLHNTNPDAKHAKDEPRSYKSVKDFSEKSNAEKKMRSLNAKLNKMTKDPQYGEFAKAAKIVKHFYSERPDRMIGGDSWCGEDLLKYNKALSAYEPLLAKTIVQKAVLEKDHILGITSNNKSLIRQLTDTAIDIYNNRLIEANIEVPQEMKRVFYDNLNKAASNYVLSTEGKGRINHTSKDRDVVAVAYAVKENDVIVMSDDTDVFELVVYAAIDGENRGLPDKTITLGPSKIEGHPILEYLHIEGQKAKQAEQIKKTG